MTILFTPTPDVVAVLNHLLDIFERRDGAPRQAVRVRLDELAARLPGYFSQVDPNPRVTANEQLSLLEQQGLVRLAWQPGQTGHLLDSVALEPAQTGPLYTPVTAPTHNRAAPPPPGIAAGGSLPARRLASASGGALPGTAQQP